MGWVYSVGPGWLDMSSLHAFVWSWSSGDSLRHSHQKAMYGGEILCEFKWHLIDWGGCSYFIVDTDNFSSRTASRPVAFTVASCLYCCQLPLLLPVASAFASFPLYCRVQSV